MNRSIDDILVELYNHPDYIDSVIFTIPDCVDRLNEQIDCEHVYLEQQHLNKDDIDAIKKSIWSSVNYMTRDIDPYPQLNELPIGIRVGRLIERNKVIDDILIL